MPNENIENLKRLADVFNTDKIISGDDLTQVLRAIMEIMAQFKTNNEKLNAETKRIVEDIYSKINEEHTLVLSTVKETENSLKNDFASGGFKEKISELKSIIEELRSTQREQAIEIENNKISNSDIEIKQSKLLDEVLSKIEIPEVEDETPESIIEKINNADTKNDIYKIDAIHIKNLPKATNNFGAAGIRYLSQLSDVIVSSPQNGDVIKYNSTTKKFENGVGGGGGGTWGSITGTLSSQTDLQTALNAKASLSGATFTGLVNSNTALESAVNITTSFGSGTSGNLVYIEATSASWDRPLLRIIDNSTAGGAANIRIDSPNPDIEFVETDQTTPAGKFEIAVQGDKFQINGRNLADNSFEQILNISRVDRGGMVGIGAGSGDTPNASLEVVPNLTGSSVPDFIFALSSAIGASSGNIFKIDKTNNLVFNEQGSAVNFRIESDTDAQNFYSDGTNNRIGIGTTTPAQKLHVKGRVQFGIASDTSGTIDLANSGAAGLTRIAPGTPGSDVTCTLPAVDTTLVGTDATQTLTNKRITVRSGTTTSSATPTINTDNIDYYYITAQAAAITSFTTNLSGTPTAGQRLRIAITDNGTARAITWGTSFESSTVTLPSTTVISTRMDIMFVWNEATSKWRCVGVA